MCKDSRLRVQTSAPWSGLQQKTEPQGPEASALEANMCKVLREKEAYLERQGTCEVVGNKGAKSPKLGHD